jgi:hypothetical protein
MRITRILYITRITDISRTIGHNKDMAYVKLNGAQIDGSHLHTVCKYTVYNSKNLRAKRTVYVRLIFVLMT